MQAMVLRATGRTDLHVVETATYPLAQANEILDNLRTRRVRGAAVLVPAQ